MLMKGWRKTTITQYQAYLKMWSFVQKNIIVMKNITFRTMLNFYLHLHKKKNVDIVQLTLPDQPFHVFRYSTVRDTSIIKRFMRNIYNSRPRKPRYNKIWDVSIVFKYLEIISST